MSAACLTVGVAGVVAFWAATEARGPGTSPLAQLFTSALSITYILTSVLMWRRSRFAAPAFLVALGFPVILSWYILPGVPISLPTLAVTFLVGLLGFWYLWRVGQRPA